MASLRYNALVVDDETPTRKLVAAALTREGFSCDLAADGLEALQQIGGRQYDAVVTDLRMPNRHGHSLAVDLLNLAKRPVIIIHTGVIEPRLAKDLLARGVDDIVFKPISLPILASKVKALVERKSAHSAAAPRLEQPSSPDGRPAEDAPVSRDDLQLRLSKLSGVLPISHAALDVYHLATNEDYEAGEIVEAIERDGSLAAELLRIGNSAQYNPSAARTSDLQQIVLRIGRRRIGEVALATNALASLTAKALPWLDVNLMWQRSMAARVAMELLIEEGRHQYLEQGLLLSASMHPLGRVILGTLFPGHYESMLGACQASGGTLREHERRLFPKNHAEVMALVLAEWKVPSDVYYPLQYVLDRYEEIASLSGPARVRVELLKLAVLVGRILVGVWMPWDTVEIPPAALFERLRLKSVQQLLERARVNFRTLLEEFGRLPCASTAGVPIARPLRYASFVCPDHDALEPLLASCGVRRSQFPVERLGEQGKPVLINAVGVEPQFLRDLLSQTAAGTHTVACDATNSQELAAWGGHLVELPVSCGQLLAMCTELAADD